MSIEAEMKTETKEQQLSFSFCATCGRWLAPDEGQVYSSGRKGAVVLCQSCNQLRNLPGGGQ